MLGFHSKGRLIREMSITYSQRRTRALVQQRLENERNKYSLRKREDIDYHYLNGDDLWSTDPKDWCLESWFILLKYSNGWNKRNLIRTLESNQLENRFNFAVPISNKLSHDVFNFGQVFLWVLMLLHLSKERKRKIEEGNVGTE